MRKSYKRWRVYSFRYGDWKIVRQCATFAGRIGYCSVSSPSGERTPKERQTTCHAGEMDRGTARAGDYLVRSDRSSVSPRLACISASGIEEETRRLSDSHDPRAASRAYTTLRNDARWSKGIRRSRHPGCMYKRDARRGVAERLARHIIGWSWDTRVLAPDQTQRAVRTAMKMVSFQRKSAALVEQVEVFPDWVCW